MVFVSVLVVRDGESAPIGNSGPTSMQPRRLTGCGCHPSEPAKSAELTLRNDAADPDAVIYARTSGHHQKARGYRRRVLAGQLLAEIGRRRSISSCAGAGRSHAARRRSSPEGEPGLGARTTLARYRAADENAVAKEAVDQSVAGARTAAASVAAAEASVASNAANVRRLEELVSFERVVAPLAYSSSSETWMSGRWSAPESDEHCRVAAELNRAANGSSKSVSSTAAVFVNVPGLRAKHRQRPAGACERKGRSPAPSPARWRARHRRSILRPDASLK